MNSIKDDIGDAPARAESNREQLIAAATERAETTPLPEEWGYRVALEQGDSFIGRWLRETVDEANNNRRVFLLLDEDDQPCFSRFYAALGREIDQAAPEVGCTIVIVRGDDYIGQQGTGYSFGVATEPNDKPLPETATSEPEGSSASFATDDIPF